ncbi:MAG: acetolactate synthase 2 small subunit, partial [Gammaproteobacteria bacterium]|nr:acetolactate synthase 2 small subunit [Gammaproteobacteria bacterium]
MTHTFKIVTNNKSAVVERLLRITRHRGFILQSMNMT